MRKVVLPLFAAVALAGCYHYETPAPAGPAEAHDTWYGRNEPLQADIWYSEFTGDVSISVSQPAYTSVFLIRPGMGTTMLFPRFRDGMNYFSGGTHRLNSYYMGGFGGYGWRSSFNSWLDPWGSGAFGYGFGHTYPYYDFGYSPWGYGGYGYPVGYGYGYGYGYGSYSRWSSLRFSQPMYLVLVASTEPLRTGMFMSGRQTMSLRFASYSVAQTTDAITNDIVVSPEYANWTTATYVVWPQAPRPPVYAMAYPYYIRPSVNPLVRDSSTFRVPAAWRPRGPEMPRTPGSPGDSVRTQIPTFQPGTGTPVPLMPTEPGRLGRPDPLTPQVPTVPVEPVDGSPEPPSARRPEGRTPIDAQPKAGVPEVPRQVAPTDRPPEQRPAARPEPQSSTPRAAPAPRATKPRESTPRAAPAPRRTTPSARPAPRAQPAPSKPAPSKPAPPPARESRSSSRSQPARRSAPRARPAPRSRPAPRAAPRAAPRPAPSRPAPRPSRPVPPPGH